jgi:hypothetical protein
VERVARHAWLRKNAAHCTLKGCKEPLFLAPFQGALFGKHSYQGLRSFHSLNPWLLSLHPFGVLISHADSGGEFDVPLLTEL